MAHSCPHQPPQRGARTLLVKTTEETGLEQIILKVGSRVAALNAEGVNADPVKETLRVAEIAGLKSVIEVAQEKYEVMTGHRFTVSKNPVKVTAAAVSHARQNRLKPELQNVPACLLSDTTIRRAAHDEWQASALPQWRGLESRGVSIPLYGERVAFVLSTAAIKD